MVLFCHYEARLARRNHTDEILRLPLLKVSDKQQVMHTHFVFSSVQRGRQTTRFKREATLRPLSTVSFSALRWEETTINEMHFGQFSKQLETRAFYRLVSFFFLCVTPQSGAALDNDPLICNAADVIITHL